MPLNESLHAAIFSATPDRLRSTLLQICNQSPATAALVSDKLLINEGNGGRVKRKQSRYEVCKNCNREFSAEKNFDGACLWHPGKKEPDFSGDFWADHDEECHGNISDLADEFPEGFRYTCCNQLGISLACQNGLHIGDAETKRRKPIEVASDDGSSAFSEESEDDPKTKKIAIRGTKNPSVNSQSNGYH
ncbi:MAG: hypothetical protein M1834_008227 [Cirrosporium novae-zelandiae]|nr:MAG: hypothetical protein M1834_008227 [Cirrosporium novae-zelandiae]